MSILCNYTLYHNSDYGDQNYSNPRPETKKNNHYNHKKYFITILKWINKLEQKHPHFRRNTLIVDVFNYK